MRWTGRTKLLTMGATALIASMALGLAMIGGAMAATQINSISPTSQTAARGVDTNWTLSVYNTSNGNTHYYRLTNVTGAAGLTFSSNCLFLGTKGTGNVNAVVGTTATTPAATNHLIFTVSQFDVAGCGGAGSNSDTINADLTVTVQPQTITFNALANKTMDQSPLTISASASSGLAVTFTSATNPVCTVAGTTVTFVTTGTCTINANQAGNINYGAAPQVQRSFVISKADQTITFNAITDKTMNLSPLTIGATASSGLAVTFTSATNPVCTVAGTTVTFVTTGTCTIRANQAGNGTYNAALQVQQSFQISKASQTINFASLPNVTFGVAPVTLSATATSGLAVSFGSATGQCSLVGNVLTVTGAGSCSVTASQAGNAIYSAASPVTRTFNIAQASQTITFAVLPDVTFGHAPITLSATASSGLAVSFGSATGQCSLVGNVLTITGGGSCSVTASQAGNANYAAAAPVIRTFSIGQASQTITFAALPNVTFGVAPITLSATASSGLAVSFGSATGQCSLVGNVLTITGAGSCSVTASQAGNANYSAAAPVTRAFNIAQASQTITFAALANVTYGVAPITLSATASSGLAVSFGSATGQCSLVGNVLTVTSSGSCSVTASQVGNANYSAAAPVTRSFNIGQASQSITFAALPNVTYGVAPFGVTATSSSGLTVGFAGSGPCTVAGNTVTITGIGTCTVTASQDGSGGVGAAESVNRSFDVAPAVLTVTAADKSKLVGQANPALTYGITGFQYGDTASVVSGAPAIGTSATAASPAGTYDIVVGGGTLAAANYTFSFENGTLTVSAKTVLTVTANSVSRNYGDPNPTLTFTVTGYPEGSDISGITLPTCTTTATADSLPGTYPITCTGAGSGEYDFSYVGGSLTITGTVVGGQTAAPVRSPTPPVTSSGSGSSNDGATPLMALLICLAFGGLGLLGVQVQRRSVRI